MAEDADLLISAGFSDAKLAQESGKVLALFQKTGQQAQKAFDDARNRVTDTQASKAHQRELDRLAKSYDPVYRAAKEYGAEVARLDRALSIGAVTQDRYNVLLDQAAQKQRAAVDTATGATAQAEVASQRAAQAAREAAQAEVEAASATSRLASEKDQLRMRLDPLYAASKRYEGSLIELDRALDLGALSAKQHEAALEQLNAQYARTAVTSGAAGAKMAAEAGKSAGAVRGQVQNLSFQVQDFAVQVAAGTSATTALGQQLPQLLGSFGALGAVIGAVVAVGVPLAAMFIKAGEAGVKYEDALKNLQEAQSRLNTSLSIANMPLSELLETYGVAAVRVQEFAEAQLRLNIAVARGALTENLSSLREVTLEYTRLGVGFSAYASAMDAIKQDFGLTGDAADQLFVKLRRLNEAASADDQLQQFQDLAKWLEAAGVPLEKLPPQFAQAAANMLDLNINAEELEALISDATRAASDLSGGISGIDFSSAISGADALSGRIAGMIGQARTLLSTLGQAAQRNLTAEGRNELLLLERDLLAAGKSRVNIEGELAKARERQQLDSAGVALPVALREDILDGARQTAEEAQRATEEIQKLNSARAEAAKPAGAGGSKGGRSDRDKDPVNIFEDAERELLQLERQIMLIGKGTEETARMRAQWELLDAAKKAGIPVNAELNAQIDAQAAQVGRLTEELERGELAQQQFDQAIDGVADAFAGALLAGESLREGLAQVFKQIASDILNSGIRNAISGQLSGGGGGLLGSIFGGLFGGQRVVGNDALSNSLRGIAGFRANGGPVSAGQTYIVGERGPEPFVPAVNGRVLSVPQAQAALRGGQGGGGQSVALTIDLRGTTGDRELDAKIAQAGQRILSQVPSIMQNENKRRG